MILLMAAVAAFAVLMGTASFVTTPVAVALTVLAVGWLVLFAARERLARAVHDRRARR